MLYNVTLKENAPAEEFEKSAPLHFGRLSTLLIPFKRAKADAKKQGGTITHEFTLFKGFTVEFAADKVHTLESNEHVDVEPDSEVKTQAS
ncbi:MAG: hypothetical protein M1833_004746 [Piccolia ochrophora]|nr:MAG: hypothetical protein M1833_004746 [Piccolia ochrophora]